MRANLVGNIYGRLTVIDQSDDLVSRNGYHTVMWRCKCMCGNEVIVRGKCLTQGVTRSCGCFQREELAKRARKHGRQGTRLYAIWDSMRQRCNNPKHKSYNNYGGRGIRISPEWDDYSIFQQWATQGGYDELAPRGTYTLDRIDVDGDYCPSNCRWVNMRIQSNNKRDTIRLFYCGEYRTLSELAQMTNIDYQTLWRRYSRGEHVDDIARPVHSPKHSLRLTETAIDKAKGIVCKPMPRSWYDFHANKLPDHSSLEDVERRELRLRILADKKPYFMRYIYPALMKDYNTYIKNTNVKCLREFRMDLKELLAVDSAERSEQQNEFLLYYHRRMPVGTNDCVMNQICRIFESEFDGYLKLHAPKEDFDYSILKDEDAEYTRAQYYAISKLYAQHNEQLQAYRQFQKKFRADPDGSDTLNIKRTFTEECFKVCSNAKVLCNIVVDLCYRKIGSQQFAWDVCGAEILSNLLKRREGRLSFPTSDPEGDIVYGGNRFSMKEVESKYVGNCVE